MPGPGAILLLSLLLWPLGPQPAAPGDGAAPSSTGGCYKLSLQGVWPRGMWGPPCQQLPPSLPARPAGSDAKGTSGALQQECWALDKLIVLQGVERSF